MTYKQLFLLIITIWSAHVCTRFVFDNVVPKKMDYCCVYIECDEEGRFHGKDLNEVGDDGWELVSVQPGRVKEEAACFFKRQTVIKW